MCEIQTIKREMDFNLLLEQESRRELFFEHRRRNFPDKYLDGIRKLCALKKWKEAAMLVSDYREECALAAREIILESIDDAGDCEAAELFHVLLELRCEERLSAFLNAEIPMWKTREEMFQIFFFYQERSEYDMVFWMLELLSRCKDLSLLAFFLYEQKGLDHYRGRYKEEIGAIVRNVWKAGDDEQLLHVIRKLFVPEYLPYFLGMERECLLEKLCRRATKASLQLAFLVLVSNDAKRMADREILERMKDLPETEDVLLTRWQYMFNGYRKGSVELKELKAFLAKCPRIEGLKNSFLPLGYTLRVLALLTAEGRTEEYQDIVSALGENDPFSAESGVGTIAPWRFYQYVGEETAAQNLEVLKSIYYERHEQDIRGFLKYYLHSHFKYVAKLRDVLELLFPSNIKADPDIFKGLKFRFRIARISEKGERLVLSGRIYDCMAGTAFIQIDKDEPLARGTWCDLELDTFIPGMPVNDGLRYKTLFAVEEENLKEIPILSRKPEYDRLFRIFDLILKEGEIKEEDVEALRKVHCPKLKGIYIQHFHQYMAQIIYAFARRLDSVAALISALNENGINLCNPEKYPNRKEQVDRMLASKEIRKCLKQTLVSWKKWYYGEDVSLGLQTGKKIAWIYRNSYMRYCVPPDEILQNIRRGYISNAQLVSECFGDCTFEGILYQNSNRQEEMLSVSMKPQLKWSLLRCVPEEREIVKQLPDRAKVCFNLYNVKLYSGVKKKFIIDICNLHEKEDGYRGMYEHALECGECLKALMDFRKRGLWRFFAYSEWLSDWCRRHLEEGRSLYHIPFGYRAGTFRGCYAGERLVIDELQDTERFVVTNHDPSIADGDGERLLILTGFELESGTLYFEDWN